VRYVKHNGLAGRQGQDVNDVRRALARWVIEIAGDRIHGTTGRKPMEVFELEEKAALKPLPTRPFDLVVWKRAQVHRDCHVQFAGRLYSVPWQRVGQHLWIRATAASVVIYADDEPVARHERSGTNLRSTLEQHLPEERSPLRHRSREFWEQRADTLGAEVGRFVREVFDADDVLSQLRKVQAIVTHLEKFPVERACAACARASHYGNLTYQAVRDILRRGLDFEPLPNTQVSTWTTAPRFARDVGELVASRLDQNGGDHGIH